MNSIDKLILLGEPIDYRGRGSYTIVGVKDDRVVLRSNGRADLFSLGSMGQFHSLVAILPDDDKYVLHRTTILEEALERHLKKKEIENA